MLGKISYLHGKFTWRGWTFNKYCNSQPHKSLLPSDTPPSWYSQTCIVSSHIVPGLGFMAKSIWQNMTSDIKLYKTVACLVFSLSIWAHILLREPSHEQAYGEPHMWLSVNTSVPLESASPVITSPLPYGKAWAKTTQLYWPQIPDSQKLFAIISVSSR